MPLCAVLCIANMIDCSLHRTRASDADGKFAVVQGDNYQGTEGKAQGLAQVRGMRTSQQKHSHGMCILVMSNSRTAF